MSWTPTGNSTGLILTETTETGKQTDIDARLWILNQPEQVISKVVTV